MNCARKHTLVTGCSSGIGRSTALRLARDGQHVYAGIRKPADGDRLARSAAGGEITPVILDVTEPGHVAAAAATIDEHTGAAGLDGLVNNAGYGLACPAELVPLDSFRRQLDVNVTGQLAVTQAVLPALRRARGRIVMVSTIGVRFSPPFAGPLDASKAALTALGEALRQELAARTRGGWPCSAGCPRQSSTWPAGASSGCPRRVPSPPDPGGAGQQPGRWPALASRALPAGWPRRRAGRGR